MTGNENEPPSYITLDLEQKDVEENFGSILTSMSKIRSESIKNRDISDKVRDEYLHLTYRLSSCIKSLVDEKTIDNMQVIAEGINNNKSLLHYDPRQDGHWKKKNNEFVQTLDNLLIAIEKDNLHTIDNKHHILQAIKYLGVSDESFEKKERIFNTILPFNKPVSLDSKHGLFSKIFGALFGIKYKIQERDNLTIRAKGSTDTNSVMSLYDLIKRRGYSNLEIVASNEDYKRLKKAIPNLSIVKSLGEAKYDSEENLIIKNSRPAQENSTGSKNINPYFDNIVSLVIPDDVEKNLEWGTANHHGFGETFIGYISKNSNKRLAKGIKFNTKIDKEKHAVIYHHKIPVGSYKKNSALFCLYNERYLTTIIASNSDKDCKIEDLTSILTQGKDQKEKVREIGLEFSPKYVHFRRFENNQLTDDYEVTL